MSGWTASKYLSSIRASSTPQCVWRLYRNDLTTTAVAGILGLATAAPVPRGEARSASSTTAIAARAPTATAPTPCHSP